MQTQTQTHTHMQSGCESLAVKSTTGWSLLYVVFYHLCSFVIHVSVSQLTSVRCSWAPGYYSLQSHCCLHTTLPAWLAMLSPMEGWHFNKIEWTQENKHQSLNIISKKLLTGWMSHLLILTLSKEHFLSGTMLIIRDIMHLVQLGLLLQSVNPCTAVTTGSIQALLHNQPGFREVFKIVLYGFTSIHNERDIKYLYLIIFYVWHR